MTPSVLLAEDDPNLGQLLQEYLNVKGFSTDLVKNGEEGLTMYVKKKYDLCILDVMMPKKDGFTLAREIRSKDQQMPIIFLTAKSSKEDTLEGLRLGADDYLTKPFSMEELLLRMKAVLRRVTSNKEAAEETNIFTIGQYEFNSAHQTLKYKDYVQKLTSKETELLKLLCLNQNQILERTSALKLIWRDDSYFNARSMDVYITKLRKYLKDDPTIEIINIHGTGYRLQVSVG
jgi:DNA-binding response OmpR family regulator